MADMPLPQAALAALQRGDKLGAIRIVREATGMDLKRAAVAVESHGQRHLSVSAPGAASATDGLQVAQQVMDALLGGKKLDAIKLLREHGGGDLKSAKQAAERLLGQHQSSAMGRNEHRGEHRLDAERAQSSARLQSIIDQKRVPTVVPGDAPGGGLGWILVAMSSALIWLFVAAASG